MGDLVEANHRQTEEEVTELRGGGLDQNKKDGRFETSGEGPQPLDDIFGGGQIPERL